MYLEALRENLNPGSNPSIRSLLNQESERKPSPGNDSSTDRQIVLTQLEKILASQSFANAERMRSLLSFIVNETLDGHSGTLKAFTIVFEVFQRDENFDPQQDPLIRVQAGNPRKRLEQYYRTEGTRDSVIIEIPKGSYHASFYVNNVSPSMQT